MKTIHLVILAAAALLVPYVQLLVATWTGNSKNAAPSMLAFAAALVLAYRSRAAVRAAPPTGTGRALAVATLATTTLTYTLAVLFDVRIFAGIGAIGLVTALLWLCCGVRAISTFVFPLILLLVATPLPAFVEGTMTRILVDLTVVIIPTLLEPIVGAVETEGAVIHMATESVAVVDECSGLGGILLFLPLAITLLALSSRRTPRHIAVLLTAAMLLAFGASLTRVLLSAVFVHFDAPLAHSDTAHEVLGIATLLGALCALAICNRRLQRPASSAVANTITEEPA